MKILLTLDYELFLGEKTGSVRKCLLDTMDMLESAAANARFTIFVDASYLARLRELSAKYGQLASEYNKICNHLKSLHARGHDLQLHVHPHWATSTFDGSQWHLDASRYKLCDLSPDDADHIFGQAKSLLDSIIGKQTIAFRAGGFSAQPTPLLAGLFSKYGIQADSSVTPGAVYDSAMQKYDYSAVPTDVGHYRFGQDITKAEAEAPFLEVPISTDSVSPLFFWGYVAVKLLKLKKYRNLGDGISVKATNESIRKRLTTFSDNIVTSDGYKIRLLESQRARFKKQGRELMTVIGHPKLATTYSVDYLKRFVANAQAQGDEFITISDLVQ